MKSSGTRTEPTVHPGSSLSTPPTSRLVTIAERSESFDESAGYSDAKEDDDEVYLEEKAAMPDLSEAAEVSVGRSGGVRSLARNLTKELDDVAGPEPATEDSDDGSDGLKPSAMKATSRSTGNRPPVNGDTPAANKVLGRCLELMKARNNWMQLFGPILCYSSVLWGASLTEFPSDAALKDWTPTDAGTALRKWKKKLRTSFGVSEIGAGRQPIARPAPEAMDPSKVPLPRTPKKRVNEGSDSGIFTAAAEASPYMQDSYMVTPRSASRSERLAEETESLRPTPNTRQETGRRPARNYDSPEDSSDSDSGSGDFDYLNGDLTEENYDSPEDSSDSDSGSGDFDYLNGDLTEEWPRQIRELSKAETISSTPRLELATLLPLSNIKPYFGLRNKSEKSMQWLRTFIYEIKGTHTPPNEWYMAFELSLQDGALHWYRQLPRKTRPKREDKEHVCDYLNRLNGYARNAGVQFKNGGHNAKDHVEHFLDTCDDRGLEERLCHVRVKDIHDLEDMVNDILRRRERAPRVRETVIVVIDTTENVVVTIHARGYRSNRPETRQQGYDSTEASSDDERRRDGSRGSSESSDSDSSHVAAANDSERRAAAEDADYMFAFAGEVNLPEDREITSVKTMENEKERGVYLSECGMKEWRSGEPSGRKTEGSIARANGSVISANYAKRALVKINLGWERVYEFEMWIMNHSAGVELILGTDFMIPAGVRLDLFHGTARLPDEVMVPLIKSLSAADDEPYGTQVVGELPCEPGYVRLRSNTYKEWQILAYAESLDETLFERERELYERWLAEQPPTVKRRDYQAPRNILTRDAEDSGPSEEVQVYCADESEHTLVSESGDRVLEQAQRRFSTYATDDALCTESSNGVASENIGASDQVLDDRVAHSPCPTEDPECILNATYVSVMHEIAAGVVSGRGAEENDVSEHLANVIELTDYAQELAFLPHLTEITVTALDYTGPNVQNKDLDEGQQQKLVDVLKRHEKIMISSGNALPPPAYGVVCDIDVLGHAPIKQRARRTPLRFLGKLYELLKGLLRAGLITFSDSPWASPIVIVLKKHGVDIRLCIDYKMVNAVTAIMEYAMPLVDDLLTDMEAYLWHFEWLRMPFGLKNASMIYQRMIDNALWGFVQPKGGWSQFAKAVLEAEEHTRDARTVATEDCNQHSEAPPRARIRFEADRESSTVMDVVSLLVNSPMGDMFANGESDESSLVPVFDRRSFVDDICFGNETFDGCLATLDRPLQRFTECRISASLTKSIFVQSKVNFLSHEVSSENIRADPKKIKVVTEVPFPTSKKGMQLFLGTLNYYSRFIQDFGVYGAALYQLKDVDFTPRGDLTVAKRSFAALQQQVMDAPILRHFDRNKEVHVMLFANEWALSSTLMQERDGKLHPVRFCGRVLKDAEMNYHPAEKEILALLLLLKVCYTQLAVVQRVKERDCLLAQLLQAGLTSFVDLDDSLAQVAPPTKGSPSIRMDPNLLYARLPRFYQGFVLSFDGSAKTEKHGGYGSCAWILWRLPEWTIVTAASAYLEATTVNLAEYAGMNKGVQAALEHTTEDLLTAKFRSVKYLHVVQEFNTAADSLASENLESKVSKVVSTETRLSELIALNRIKDVIYEPTAKAETEDKPSVNTTGRLTVTTRQHAKVNEKRVRFANEISVVARREADSQDKANNAPTKEQNHVREEQLITEDPTSTVPSANDIDHRTVQRERRRRIAVAQDEELMWSNLKTVLRGEDSKLGYRAARDSWKMSDRFTLSEDNVLYYLGTSRRKSDRQQEETFLRLVVPSTMVQEVLQNCHDSLEGGHQGIVRTFNRIRQDYFWIGLYADVEQHVRSCPDSSSSKSRRQFRGYSPGNVLAERPFQLVSIDFVIPLPKSRRGNTALLLFQCAFTGFVMGKAMADTTALCVAKAFEECVYRRFGAPTMIRHDRDPRFMSEVFQAFAEMMQSRSRATLSYRPQANGQQERSVNTVMQSVRVYAEDPLQQDLR
ncbi:Hypothetical protein PHPALM_6441 [Phytophthora palmivora]|uniref:Integrase catalytic domain-containing protein n=1 Tax=Phytophthora palmivora TaxID=4796 RepID=A0A2P4YET8_9STRA|nr:Hypothetical protein PHPALM_6441 [Phytophthora palmivora]